MHPRDLGIFAVVSGGSGSGVAIEVFIYLVDRFHGASACIETIFAVWPSWLVHDPAVLC